jgi:hypothetical protein
MPRAAETRADYFPFYAKDGRTLFILQSKYGLEGIGFFTNLLRALCTTPGHILDLSNPVDHLYTTSRIGVIDEKRADDMLEIMVQTGKIDARLWQQKRIIYSQDFVDSLDELYRKRKCQPPKIEDLYIKYKIRYNYGAEMADYPESTKEGAEETRDKGAEMPQRKEGRKKRKSSIDSAESTRKGYGEFLNVFLSDAEYKKLCFRYSESVVTTLIENMGRWMRKVGKDYKDYYAALLDWAKRDKTPEAKHELDCPYCQKPMVDNLCRNDDCPQYQEDLLKAEEL